MRKKKHFVLEEQQAEWSSRKGTSRFSVQSQTQRFSLSIECLYSNRRELGSEFDIIIVVSPERWLMWNFHHFPVTMIEIKLVYTIKVSVITEGIFHGYILSFEGFVRNVWESWLVVKHLVTLLKHYLQIFQIFKSFNTYARFLLWSQKLWWCTGNHQPLDSQAYLVYQKGAKVLLTT